MSTIVDEVEHFHVDIVYKTNLASTIIYFFDPKIKFLGYFFIHLATIYNMMNNNKFNVYYCRYEKKEKQRNFC